MTPAGTKSELEEQFNHENLAIDFYYANEFSSVRKIQLDRLVSLHIGCVTDCELLLRVLVLPSLHTLVINTKVAMNPPPTNWPIDGIVGLYLRSQPPLATIRLLGTTTISKSDILYLVDKLSSLLELEVVRPKASLILRKPWVANISAIQLAGTSDRINIARTNSHCFCLSS